MPSVARAKSLQTGNLDALLLPVPRTSLRLHPFNRQGLAGPGHRIDSVGDVDGTADGRLPVPLGVRHTTPVAIAAQTTQRLQPAAAAVSTPDRKHVVPLQLTRLDRHLESGKRVDVGLLDRRLLRRVVHAVRATRLAELLGRRDVPVAQLRAKPRSLGARKSGVERGESPQGHDLVAEAGGGVLRRATAVLTHAAIAVQRVARLGLVVEPPNDNLKSQSL